MRLLFDQNLSFRLCRLLDDIFPQSTQTGLVGLSRADDLTVWNYAGAQGLTLVSLDSDFADLAALHGPPPKVIWLRIGNGERSQKPSGSDPCLRTGTRSGLS